MSKLSVFVLTSVLGTYSFTARAESAWIRCYGTRIENVDLAPDVDSSTSNATKINYTTIRLWADQKSNLDGGRLYHETDALLLGRLDRIPNYSSNWTIPGYTIFEILSNFAHGKHGAQYEWFMTGAYEYPDSNEYAVWGPNTSQDAEILIVNSDAYDNLIRLCVQTINRGKGRKKYGYPVIPRGFRLDTMTARKPTVNIPTNLYINLPTEYRIHRRGTTGQPVAYPFGEISKETGEQKNEDDAKVENEFRNKLFRRWNLERKYTPKAGLYKPQPATTLAVVSLESPHDLEKPVLAKPNMNDDEDDGENVEADE